MRHSCARAGAVADPTLGEAAEARLACDGVLHRVFRDLGIFGVDDVAEATWGRARRAYTHVPPHRACGGRASETRAAGARRGGSGEACGARVRCGRRAGGRAESKERERAAEGGRRSSGEQHGTSGVPRAGAAPPDAICLANVPQQASGRASGPLWRAGVGRLARRGERGERGEWGERGERAHGALASRHIAVVARAPKALDTAWRMGGRISGSVLGGGLGSRRVAEYADEARRLLQGG